MKKFLVVLLIFAGTAVKINAQDLIKKTDGSEIRAKITESSPDVVKYKLYDNPDGPTYIVSKTELVSITYATGLVEKLGAAETSAPVTNAPVANAPAGNYTTTPQNATTTSPTVYKPPVTTLSSSDLKTQMQMQAPDLYQKYQKKTRLKKAGWWIAGGGIAIAAVGIATGDNEIVTTGTSVSYNVKGTGGAIAAVGSVCIISGVIMAIVGNSGRKKVESEFLSRSSSYSRKSPLQSPHFEIIPNGLAFKF
jgi:hypothetical protein